MTKYHGIGYRGKLWTISNDKKKLIEQQVEAQSVARRLFSSAVVGSTGSVRTAADTSVLLNRSNHILPSKEVYDELMTDMDDLRKALKDAQASILVEMEDLIPARDAQMEAGTPSPAAA